MISKNAALMFFVTAWLTACGGGGVATGALTNLDNDSSSNSSASVSLNVTVSKLELVDGLGKVLTHHSLSQTEVRQLKITTKNLQAFKRVELTIDNQLAVITPASRIMLTDENGVALFTIAPASLETNGVVRASGKVTDTEELTNSLDLQIVPGSVALAGLSVSPAAVQIGQSVTVSVNALVDNVAAPAKAVSVAFSSNCGAVTPASVPVDSAGKAAAVIQTNITGACSVLATTGGVAVPLSASIAVSGIAVTGAPVIGLKFVKADPQIIYLRDSIGAKTSLLTFKVFDASGNGVTGQKVNVSLIGTGVDFCGLPTQALTAATGEVSFLVCSGTQPATAQVRATLDGSSIGTDSNLLTVQSGLPSQRFFEIVAAKLNFYAGGYFTDKFSGLSVPISVFAADRQGNAVPDGTPVIFVTEGGQINSNGQSSCIIRNGSCSVNLIGQDYRPMGSSVPGADPRPGRVTVLAMADGEEHFIDANNNNKYDPGELFEDLGRPFLDKDEDGVFTPAYRNLVTNTNEGDANYPMASAAEGRVACSSNVNARLSVAGTCNAEWNGSGVKPDGTAYVPTKVRRAATIIFSGGEIGYPNAPTGSCSHSFAPGSYDATIPVDSRTELLSCSRSNVFIRLADRNGNPMPADATLAVAVRKATGSTSACAATLAGGAAVIGNSTEPTFHQILLTSCVGGESVDLSVSVANGRTTVFTVVVP